jgi:hypothetical protein
MIRHAQTTNMWGVVGIWCASLINKPVKTNTSSYYVRDRARRRPCEACEATIGSSGQAAIGQGSCVAISQTNVPALISIYSVCIGEAVAVHGTHLMTLLAARSLLTVWAAAGLEAMLLYVCYHVHWFVWLLGSAETWEGEIRGSLRHWWGSANARTPRSGPSRQQLTILFVPLMWSTSVATSNN